MAAILTLLAILTGFVGLFFLTEATTGVGIIGLACLFGILARLSQAGKQHKELKGMLEKQKDL